MNQPSTVAQHDQQEQASKEPSISPAVLQALQELKKRAAAGVKRRSSDEVDPGAVQRLEEVIRRLRRRDSQGDEAGPRGLSQGSTAHPISPIHSQSTCVQIETSGADEVLHRSASPDPPSQSPAAAATAKAPSSSNPSASMASQAAASGPPPERVVYTDLPSSQCCPSLQPVLSEPLKAAGTYTPATMGSVTAVTQQQQQQQQQQDQGSPAPPMACGQGRADGAATATARAHPLEAAAPARPGITTCSSAGTTSAPSRSSKALLHPLAPSGHASGETLHAPLAATASAARTGSSIPQCQPAPASSSADACSPGIKNDGDNSMPAYDDAAAGRGGPPKLQELDAKFKLAMEAVRAAAEQRQREEAAGARCRQLEAEVAELQQRCSALDADKQRALARAEAAEQRITAMASQLSELRSRLIQVDSKHKEELEQLARQHQKHVDAAQQEMQSRLQEVRRRAEVAAEQQRRRVAELEAALEVSKQVEQSTAAKLEQLMRACAAL